MPTIEAQIMTWLSSNWPSALAGLSVGITYVVVYLRLQKFLSRVEQIEGEIVKLNRSQIRMGAKIARITLHHCQKNPEDMEDLMRIDEDNAA